MTSRFEAKRSVVRTTGSRAFCTQPLMAFIGAELVSVKPGACAIRLPFRTELAQQNGFHGGIVGTLADNAGALPPMR